MAILSSHKQGVTFIEYAKIVKADDRVAYVKENRGIEQTFSLPYGNMAILLLGPGTSITQAAMHHLCSEGCLVAFTGGNGYPIIAGSLSEYRPTEYAQGWMRRFFEEGLEWKLKAGCSFQAKRVDLVNKRWATLGLDSDTLALAGAAGDIFLRNMPNAKTKENLLGFEANYAKSLYGALAKQYGIQFTRQPQSKSDLVNDLIDTQNYYAYGLAGATLWALGIPFSLPVLHGDTRRGALVFDVADIVKDAYLLPLAFESAKQKLDKSAHKKICAEHLQTNKVMPILFDEIKKAIEL